MEFEDIIQFETESTYCDFKATQYSQDPSDKVRDFLVDIMAFANADIDTDRYIVIGIKHKNDVERLFLGIDKNKFSDPAIYQQIVHQNIEPDIDFDYLLFEYMGKYYGIFKIINCNQQPYLMKKDYGDRLKKGDSYIRKGRHNAKMERQDFERIYQKKSSQNTFTGDVEIK
ncbi:MAG: ATP-binding protein, partial [Methanobacterium sp.]